MGSISEVLTQDTLRRIQRIQVITIIWMCIETTTSLSGAWMARSPALLAFGGDSAVELLSAAVVLLRFTARLANPDAERRAARVAGALLFALAAYVTVVSVMSLLGHNEPRPTYLGISVLVAAAVIMPWIAKEKCTLSARIGSTSLRADAAQSGLCAILSAIALAGLTVNAVWGIKWADPVAALVVVPLVLSEARQAIRGKACGCC
jgi:divalent metal cation (Fe/Co/Zn/Cd) transporter